MKRRNRFIICFVVSALVAAGFSSGNPALHTQHRIQETGTADQYDMIGCLTGEVDLENRSGDLEDVRGHDITFSAGFDKDLARQRCSAFVIDKHLIGEGVWDTYAEFLHEYHNDTPLMIVDNITDWIMSSKVKGES